MGTWGTGIKDNDTACDVYSDYISLLETLPVKDVMAKMTDFYKAKINSHGESNNFWLALALTQMDTNTLQKGVAERAKTIIETGADLALWKELRASDTDIGKRKEELAGFLVRLKSHVDLHEI